MKYYQVFISAEDKEQATTILNALLEKKLILGGPILQGATKFWWEDEIVNMPEYSYIFTYTTEKLKQDVLEEYEKVSVEDVPMISFIEFEGNPKLLELIDKTLSS